MPNLNDIANQISRDEGGAYRVRGAPQVKEIMRLLGERWRDMSFLNAMKEFMAIRSRAGRSGEEDK